MSVKVRQENVLDCGALQYVYTTSREMIVIFPRYNTHPVRSAEFTAAEAGLCTELTLLAPKAAWLHRLSCLASNINSPRSRRTTLPRGMI